MQPARRELPRLLWITDGQGDAQRVLRIAAAAVAGGLRAIQLREPRMPARAQRELGLALLRLLAPQQGLLFVNDRVDVALACGAHGVQLREDSLPAVHVRELAPQLQIGVSVHGAEGLRAAAGRADFAILAPLFAPASKPTAEPLGIERAAALVAGAEVPVLLLGGLDAARIATLPPQLGAGVAVMSAIAGARDVAQSVVALRAAVEARWR